MTDLTASLPATEAFMNFFDEQEYCDVQFIVDSTTIGAHKGFLLARSKVLGELSKDWTPTEKPIAINDVSEDTFRAVLR